MARWTRTDDGGGPASPQQDTRTTPEVIASLVVNAQALLAKQVELLTLELRAAISRRIAAVVMLLVATVAGGLAVLLGAVTAAVALESVMDERWQAWGVVALAVLVPTLILIIVAARLASTPVASGTRQELDATTAWLRDVAGVGADGDRSPDAGGRVDAGGAA